jgi:hypothetical protein
VGEIIDVYGKAQHELSKDFILELSEKLLGCNFFSFCSGRGFQFRSPNEKSNANVNPVLMDLFNSFIVDMDMSYIG